MEVEEVGMGVEREVEEVENQCQIVKEEVKREKEVGVGVQAADWEGWAQILMVVDFVGADQS